MFCEKCGAPIEEGAKFCENCGTPVAQDVTPTAAAAPAAVAAQDAKLYHPDPNRYKRYMSFHELAAIEAADQAIDFTD